MTNITKIERATLETIIKHEFTFKGDNIFRTYRQATITLNRLERTGLVKRETHDTNMFVITSFGREVFRFPNIPIAEIKQWAA